MPAVSAWTVTDRQTVYRDRWITVQKVRVRLPNGQSYDYTTVRRLPGAAVWAVNPTGDVLLLREYRFPLNQIIYQLPGGLIDPGESPEKTARRELREETGYTAESLVFLGTVHDNPGLMVGRTTLFLARDLHRRGAPEPETTESSVAEWIPLKVLQEWIRRGLITDRIVLSAFALWIARRDLRD